MSAFRSFGAARALAALTVAALALAATAAFAYVPPDSAQIAPYVSLRIEPPNPCPGDSVTLFVTDSCGPCLEQVGIVQLGADDVHAMFRVAPSAVCAASPCAAKWMSVNLGPRPVGSNKVVVTVIVQVPADSQTVATQFTFHKTIAFAVSDTCAGTPLPVPGDLPFVERAMIVGAGTPCDTCPPHVCAGKPVVVRVGGFTPNTCIQYRGLHFLPTMSPIDRPIVVLEFASTCGSACAQHTTAWSDSFLLPTGAAGPHSYQLSVAINTCPDTVRRVVGYRNFPFVTDSCRVPLPIPGYLPYVEHATLANSTTPCDTCSVHVCSGKYIMVHVGGHTPSSCTRYRGHYFLPLMSEWDHQAVVLEFTNTCDAACLQYTPAWSDSFLMPTGVAGAQGFRMSVAINACPDTVRSVVGYRDFNFVSDSCEVSPPAPTGCVGPFLIPLPRMGYLSDGCNLKLTQRGTGIQSFAVQADSIPLAGLQGVVRAGAGLHILGLAPAGPAARMHLVTRATGTDAVSFVLYADTGAPIPAPFYDAVLDVRVKADSTLRVGSRSLISGTVTAASDSTGSSLRLCTVDTFAPVVAQVCIEPAATCDANGDGVVNVADLVRMARCWVHPATCPDTTASRPDCNNDGVFGVADIFCCARTILGGGMDDSTRVAPGLTLAFGTPAIEQGMVRVGLEIRGASAMNGALLRVRFPADRYAYVPPVDPGSASGQWLPLTEPGDGDVLVGVLRLDDAAPDVVTVPLQFRVLDGQAAGGTLSADQAQVIAPDGGSIAVNLGQLTTNLPSGGPATITRVELLCGPNPASGSTRFIVRLPQGGPVDLGIFDVAGRRVETLYRGSLASGETAFTWQPGSARGLYFARLAVNGVVRTTRVTMQLAR